LIQILDLAGKVLADWSAAVETIDWTVPNGLLDIGPEPFVRAHVAPRCTGKGPGSKAAGLAMAFELIEAAQHRWRAVNAPHLVALVRAGAHFERGNLVERHPEAAAA